MIRSKLLRVLRSTGLKGKELAVLNVLRLMVQKSQTTTWGCIPNPVNNGINYQPQLVSRISEPSTVVLGCHRNFRINMASNGMKGSTYKYGGDILGVTHVPREFSRNHRNRGYCGRELCYNKHLPLESFKNKLFKSDETAQWKLDQLGRSVITWWVGGRDLD